MSHVDRVVAGVRRRLFGQLLIQYLLWCAAVSILGAGFWFFVQQLLLPDAGRVLVWTVAIGLVLVGVVGAGVLSWMRRPSRLLAALLVDEKFGLKERVTTLLSLSAAELQTPAGTALLADLEPRLDKLDFSGKLPVSVGWIAGCAPVFAIIIAVLAYVSDPSWLLGGNPTDAAAKKQIVLSEDAQSKLETLKALPLQKRELDPEDAEKLKELEDAWKKLIEKPAPKTAEQIRERVKEIRTLEEQLKERTRQMQEDANKEGELRAALKKLDDLDPKDKKLGEGPMRDLEEALSEGKFDKAEDIIERLQKKLQNKELDKQQQQELAKELAKLEQKLKRLMDSRDMQNMKELEELAKLLGECKDGLASEQDQEISAEKMRELLKNLKDMKTMGLSKQQLKQMQKGEDDLVDAREALLLSLNRGNGMNGGGPPGGRRPVGEEPKDSKIKDERQTGQIDPNGQLQITGFSRGGTFSKIPARDVGGAFKQAVQDAPEAIERQQIPPDAADIAKGYFKKLAGE